MWMAWVFVYLCAAVVVASVAERREKAMQRVT